MNFLGEKFQVPPPLFFIRNDAMALQDALQPSSDFTRRRMVSDRIIVWEVSCMFDNTFCRSLA